MDSMVAIDEIDAAIESGDKSHAAALFEEYRQMLTAKERREKLEEIRRMPVHDPRSKSLL